MGVGDRAGVESSAHRPQSAAFGVEVFPDLWSKAAAYVHGIATTQHFTDGNKRTAWYAAVSFLRLNGYPLPSVSTIEAEFVVQGVAQDVFRTDESPDETITKLAEWFQTKCESYDVRPTDSLLEWVILAQGASFTPGVDGGAVDMVAAGLRALKVVGPVSEELFPVQAPVFVVGRLHWQRGDDLASPNIFAVVRNSVPGVETVFTGVVPVIPGSGLQHVKTVDPRYERSRLRPLLFVLQLNPVFLAAGDYTVTVLRDGDVIAELPLSVLAEVSTD